jgi:hypothetical protein
MASTTTIAAQAQSLNRHAITYNKDILQVMRAGLECERMFTPRACDNTYSAVNAQAGELIQAYQSKFTPKSSVGFDAIDWKLRKIKIDMIFTADDLEKYFDSWMVEWHEIGKDPVDWSFYRYLYDTVFTPKLLEEMNHNAMKGEYQAPADGVAGLSINSLDGYIINFSNGVDNGDIAEIVTGAIGANDAVQKIETFCDGLPELYRDLSGRIYCSHTTARHYARDYRAQFGTGNGVAGNENTGLSVDYSNKRLEPLHCLSESNGLIFVPDTIATLNWGTRRGFPTMPQMRWEPFERSVKGMCEFYRFYGWEFNEEVFINDQFTPAV